MTSFECSCGGRSTHSGHARDCTIWGRSTEPSSIRPRVDAVARDGGAVVDGDGSTERECSCGGIDAVPHATDHAPDCAIWGDRVQQYRGDDFDDEGFVLTCTHCGGEGEFWGAELPGYDPGWHDPERLYPCPACSGSGERRDQRIF